MSITAGPQCPYCGETGHLMGSGDTYACDHGHYWKATPCGEQARMTTHEGERAHAECWLGDGHDGPHLASFDGDEVAW